MHKGIIDDTQRTHQARVTTWVRLDPSVAQGRVCQASFSWEMILLEPHYKCQA